MSWMMLNVHLSYNEQIIMLLDVEHTPGINQNNEVFKETTPNLYINNKTAHNDG